MTGSATMPEPTWLSALRATGRARFEATGLPSTRLEAWRYFPTRGLRGVDLVTPPAAASPDVADRALAAAVAGARLPGVGALAVFVDGRFAPALSDLGALPAGVHVGGLADALADAADTDADTLKAQLGRADANDPLVAANAAAFADGLRCHVPAGICVADPVQALFVATGAAPDAGRQPRSVVTVGRAAELTLIVSYVGASADVAGATNAVTELALDDGATLRHVVVEDEAAGAVHVGHVHARVGRDATYRSFVLSLGGDAARTSIRAELTAPGASCDLGGLYLPTGSQRLDHYTEVDHQAPHTSSDSYYAGVIDDVAVGNFLGVVFIREGAAKSDARQLNKNLLLSAGAQANTKPQLEIDNDDVKAAHGATVGQLEERALFYLLSRGLDPRAARGLLTYAFARDALSRVGAGVFAEALARRVVDKLGADAAVLDDHGRGDDDELAGVLA